MNSKNIFQVELHNAQFLINQKPVLGLTAETMPYSLSSDWL